MSAVEKQSDLSPNTLAMLQASDVVEDVSLDSINTSGKQSQLMLLATLYPLLAKAAHLTNSNDPSSAVPEDVKQFLQMYQTLVDTTNEGFEQLNAQVEEIEAALSQIIQSLPQEGEELGTALKGLATQFLNSLQGASSEDLAIISQFLDEEIEAITKEQAAAEAPEAQEPATPQVNYKAAVSQMVGSLMTLSAEVATTEAENSEYETDVMNDLKTSLTAVMTNQSNNIFETTQKQLRMQRRSFFTRLITPKGLFGALGHAIGGEKGAKIASFIAGKIFSIKTIMLGPVVGLSIAFTAIALKGAEERYGIKTPKEYLQNLGEQIGGEAGKKTATIAFEISPGGSKLELLNQGAKLILDQIGNEQLTEGMKKTRDTKGLYAIDLAFKELFQSIANDPNAEWVDSAARWTTVALIATVLIAIIAVSIIFAPEALGEEAEVAADLAPEALGAAGEGAAVGVEAGSAAAINTAVESVEATGQAFEDLSATFLPDLFAEAEESSVVVEEVAEIEEATSTTDQMLERLKTAAESFKEKGLDIVKNPNKLLASVQSLMGVYKAYFDTMNTITLSDLAKVQRSQGYSKANLQTMSVLMEQIQQSMTQAFKMAEQSVSSLGQSQNISAVTNQALFAVRAMP